MPLRQARARPVGKWPKETRSATFKVGCVFGVALAFVLGVFRIGAKGPAATGKRITRRGHGLGRNAFLDPVGERAEQIELIERTSACAMAHSRHEIELAPFLNGLEPAIGCRHGLVVVECIEGREPRIAVPVVEDQLAAMGGEGGKVCVGRVDERLSGFERLGVDINLSCGGWWSEDAGTGNEDSPDAGR